MSTTRMKHLKPDLKLKSGGPVAERVAQLLADPLLSLADIADRVVSDVPNAKTSARSVASVASQLRRDGYRVPDRRRAVGRAPGVAAQRQPTQRQAHA